MVLNQLVPITSGLTTHDQIIASLIGLLGICITALVYIVKTYGNSKTAAEQSTQTNDAVNHKEHGETRIFEQVREIHVKLDAVLATQAIHQQFWDDHHQRWGRLPDDLDDETGLIIALRDLRSSIDDVKADVVEIRAQITELHPGVRDGR